MYVCIESTRIHTYAHIQDLARALERIQHLIVRNKAPKSADGAAADVGKETITARIQEAPAILELTFLHNQVGHFR